MGTDIKGGDRHYMSLQTSPQTELAGRVGRSVLTENKNSIQVEFQVRPEHFGPVIYQTLPGQLPDSFPMTCQTPS